MLKKITQHPLMLLLKNNQGNPRILILMEPLWGIPFNLIAPFVTLFMYVQGITDAQIGLILSLGMVAQVCVSFFAGIITDKFGRRTGTIIGDFCGWSIACLIWMISNNFWLFLLATLINSIEQIGGTAWTCLLVEDAEEEDMVGIFTWVHIGGLIAVFFAPITGFFIARYSLVPVMRTIYGVYVVTMAVKAYLTYRYCTETKRGVKRMKATKSMRLSEMVLEYKPIIKQMLVDINLKKVVILNVLLRVTGLVASTFFGLYITRALELPESYLAFFPILNAIVMLVFMIGLQKFLERFKIQISMWAGLILLASCQLLLVLIQPQNVVLVVTYVLFMAIGNALIMPRQGALLQLIIDEKERARMLGLIATFTIVLTAPFGYIIGLLSSWNQRLPFILALGFFVIAMLIVATIKIQRPSEVSQK